MAPSPIRLLNGTSSRRLLRPPYTPQTSITSCSIWRFQLAEPRCRLFNSSVVRSQIPSSPPPPPPSTPPSASKGDEKEKQRSRHASWYSDTLPQMIPIALLGFVVYELLEIARLSLVREHQTMEHIAQIKQKIEELDALKRKIESEMASQAVAQDNRPGVPATPRSWWRPFG
ncbi:hypothetical protein FRC19_005162 [Serendipita sp. 401]|nr:hypothetical protein FRC19_005162 [Serendipita sp. 401]KAG9056530.1 hypothetical protein FS842_010367 [Serendipita sp. 407]